MTALHVTTKSILSSFLPRLAPSTVTRTTRFTTLYSRQLSLPVLPVFGFALPSAIQLNVPGIIEGIWESILRAVPKKKTSHMKKRHRQMAGKGLKDVTALNICSACGHVKRAHLLCPYCVKEIQSMFKGKNPDHQTGGAIHLPGEKLIVKGPFLVRKEPLESAVRAAAERVENTRLAQEAKRARKEAAAKAKAEGRSEAE